MKRTKSREKDPQNKIRDHPVIWTNTPTEYVDIETGESITATIAKRNYKIIKTEKYARFNEIRTRATKYTIKHCQREPRLFE